MKSRKVYQHALYVNLVQELDIRLVDTLDSVLPNRV